MGWSKGPWDSVTRLEDGGLPLVRPFSLLRAEPGRRTQDLPHSSAPSSAGMVLL